MLSGSSLRLIDGTNQGFGSVRKGTDEHLPIQAAVNTCRHLVRGTATALDSHIPCSDVGQDWGNEVFDPAPGVVGSNIRGVAIGSGSKRNSGATTNRGCA